MPEVPARRLAVVTGASSGIGESFARQLAALGYDLLLTARREEKLQALAAEIRAARGIAVDIIAVDLATDTGRDLLAGRIRAAGNLGLLVNNAGFGSVGLVHKASLQIQDEMQR